jgi:arylsulfatase A-like enzyme
MTSLYPADLGIVCTERDCRHIRVDERRVTLAETLRQGDYVTASFTANPLLADDRGFCQGFDTCVDYRVPEAFDLPSLQESTLFGTLQEIAPQSETFLAQAYFSLFDPGTLLGPGEDINRWVIPFLRQHQGQRFFLWLHYMEPHAPYNPSRPFHPLPSEVEAEWVARARRRWHGTTMAHQKVLSSSDIEALRSLYAGEVRDVDDLVGQVLDELATVGLTDRTIVIVTADHGEEFAEHDDYSHGHALYREVVRVPLIIAGPPVQTPGRQVDTAVSLLDLFPTLVELVGVDLPPATRGRSLMPFLRGELGEARPIFSESINSRRPHESKAIRWQQYVLIYNVAQGTAELYDRSTDPPERVNLAPAMAEVVQPLLADLQSWMEETARLAALLATTDTSPEIDQGMQDALRDLGY